MNSIWQPSLPGRSDVRTRREILRANARTPQPWTGDAACTGSNLRKLLFFPDHGPACGRVTTQEQRSHRRCGPTWTLGFPAPWTASGSPRPRTTKHRAKMHVAASLMPGAHRIHKHPDCHKPLLIYGEFNPTPRTGHRSSRLAPERPRRSDSLPFGSCLLPRPPWPHPGEATVHLAWLAIPRGELGPPRLGHIHNRTASADWNQDTPSRGQV